MCSWIKYAWNMPRSASSAKIVEVINDRLQLPFTSLTNINVLMFEFLPNFISNAQSRPLFEFKKGRSLFKVGEIDDLIAMTIAGLSALPLFFLPPSHPKRCTLCTRTAKAFCCKILCNST